MLLAIWEWRDGDGAILIVDIYRQDHELHTLMRPDKFFFFLILFKESVVLSITFID